MMTDEEKRTFLRKMGYNPRMLDPDPHITKRKLKEGTDLDDIPRNHVDKQELLSVYRIFHKDDSNKEA